jgi:hypothetical protein
MLIDPCEDGDENINDIVRVLVVIEELINSNSDFHVVIGGDFNVNFSRDRTHAALLNSFIQVSGLIPADWHAVSHIDYTYKFNMQSFSFFIILFCLVRCLKSLLWMPLFNMKSITYRIRILFRCVFNLMYIY